MKKKKVLAIMLAAAVGITALPSMQLHAAELYAEPGIGAEAVVETRAKKTAVPMLNLKFEDNLTDASASQIQAAAGNGKSVSYEAGVNGKGKALTLDGATYLDLGKNTALSPAKLTLSFWFKPKGKMTGEQIFTWNKTKYFSDGWYLASESDKMPLSLSVGPAAENKQPYKIAVSGDRSEFFPADQWTHIVVTYDSDTKEAAVYRNGIPQNAVVNQPVSTTSTGVIGPCADDSKTIGFNGPSYKGSYLKGALDEYRLYQEPLSLEDAVDLYDEGGVLLDRKAVAEGDLEKVTLPESTSRNLTLPTKGESGSVISWSSSNEQVIAGDGKVTRPAEDTIVKLTGSASFAGGTAATWEFSVTVSAEGSKGNPDAIQDCGMDNVVLADSYLKSSANIENDYLLSLNSKKFLYEFYVVSGLTPPTTERYQGWERSNGSNFRGHTFGHYMSALAQAYKGTADQATKEKLLVQIRDAVNGLKECQDAYAAKNPGSAGYISAFRESALNRVDGTGSSDENVIVPWYNLHKVLAGLIDIYVFADDADNGNLAGEALAIAEKFSEYVYNRCIKLTDNKKMLGTEYGGMNEALYEIYDITGNDHFKAAAQYFDEISLFDNLASGNDVLSGKHANTTIPKFIGALKRYTVLTGNPDYYAKLTDTEKNELEKYKTAAINFWDIVIAHHTYVTGGNSRSEHFHDADILYGDATVNDYQGAITCETCNTYNMLKLSRELYKLTKDKKYMDYYENTYINAILSSQNPETGTTMYFQPMAPGYNKVFNKREHEFWCCTGTGMENFSKLGDTMYFTEKTDVYVNMYFSNTFTYAKQNLMLTQTANMPNEDKVVVNVAAADGNQVAEGTNLRFRIPDWTAGEATILVNGTKQGLTAADRQSGYVTVANVKAGDTVELTFPMEVKAYTTQDNRNFAAFKYGPVFLSTALGTNNIEASEPNGILVRVGTKDNTCQSVITVQDTTVEEWLANARNNLVRIEDSADGKVQFKMKNTDSPDLVYTPHFMRYKERYGLYMNFEEPDSQAGQKRVLEKKEALREEEMALDTLTNFDENNSEFAKNLKSEKSSVGTYNGRQFRHAEKDGGWFSYDLQINPQAEHNYLKCTWFSGDKSRNFDLYINGEKLQDITITEDAGKDVFYTQTIEIPQKYWSTPAYKKDDTGADVLDSAGNKIPIVNVKFASNGKAVVGGLYGVQTSDTLEYSKNPNLSSLSFEGGTLSPALSDDISEYTLSVPAGTASVKMTAKGEKESGLVYIDGILYDNSQPRAVKLDSLPKAVDIISKAQDHETEKAYVVHIKQAGTEVCSVKLDANGGKTVKTLVDVAKGGKIAKMPEAARDGYSFVGWYTQKEGGKRIAQGTVVEADMTVYAHWAQVQFGASGSQTEKDNTYLIAMTGDTSAEGNKNSAAYIKDETATGGNSLGSTRIGCLAFELSEEWRNLDLDKIRAVVTIDVARTNHEIGASKTKAGLFAVNKKLSEVTMTDDATYPAKNDDYSKAATVFSDEWILAANPGKKNFDVTNIIKELLQDKDSTHAVFRLQTVTSGFYVRNANGAPTLRVFEKSLSSYTVPQGLAATYGDTLADITLPEGFEFEDKLTTPVGAAGNRTFKVRYTPKDTKNYLVAEGIDINVKVMPKKVTDAKVTGIEDMFYTGKAITQKNLQVEGYKAGTDYTVSYGNNVKAGTATVTILFLGNYSGTIQKTFLIKMKVPEKNKVYKDKKYQYKVTKSADRNGTVELKAPLKKTMASVSVPSTVKINGYTFKVTSIAKNAFKNNKKLTKVTIGANVTKIGANAFSGCKKLKKITVKTKKLKAKAVGRNAFKGIHKKAVIRVPKGKSKAYKKVFKGKGQSKTVKIK